MKLHHGCNNPKALFSAIADSRKGLSGLKAGLHLAPSDLVARNYGKYLITFLLAADVAHAHVGMINKEGNQNAKVGNGIEVVLDNSAAVESFVSVVRGALVSCPDGRVVKVDIDTGEIIDIVSDR